VRGLDNVDSKEATAEPLDIETAESLKKRDKAELAASENHIKRSSMATVRNRLFVECIDEHFTSGSYKKVEDVVTFLKPKMMSLNGICLADYSVRGSLACYDQSSIQTGSFVPSADESNGMWMYTVDDITNYKQIASDGIEIPRQLATKSLFIQLRRNSNNNEIEEYNILMGYCPEAVDMDTCIMDFSPKVFLDSETTSQHPVKFSLPTDVSRAGTPAEVLGVLMSNTISRLMGFKILRKSLSAQTNSWTVSCPHAYTFLVN